MYIPTIAVNNKTLNFPFFILEKTNGKVTIKNMSKYMPILVIIETLYANNEIIVAIKDNFPYISSFPFNLFMFNNIRKKKKLEIIVALNEFCTPCS